jgi:hypothetical protein
MFISIFLYLHDCIKGRLQVLQIEKSEFSGEFCEKVVKHWLDVYTSNSSLEVLYSEEKYLAIQ